MHTIRLSYSNVHVIESPQGIVLIDSGYERDVDELHDKLVELLGARRVKEDVRLIVVTHGHTDHAGGAAKLRERTGARIIAGAGDAPLFAHGKNDKLCPTSSRAESDLEELRKDRYTAYKPDLLIAPHADPYLALGPDADLVVESIPGHTHGTLVAVFNEEAAFVGDLFRGAIVGSSAETHFYMCDLHDNLDDMTRFVTRHPKVATYYTGHFGPVSREALLAHIKTMREELSARTH